MSGWMTLLLIVIAVELAAIWMVVNVLHNHLHELLEDSEKFGYKE